MQPTLTIGADPEFFLGQNKELKSSIDLVGGSKWDPKPLGRPGFFVQEDNVAVEFNIPPAKTVEEFVTSIQWGIQAIEKEVQPLGLQPMIQASAIFPETELMDGRAQTFGCDPDFNFWKTKDFRKPKMNPKPKAKNPNLRSCGGHIHVGFEKGAFDPLKFLKFMDLRIGVPSVLMDDDNQRRFLYGRAGAFRPTPWGVEYRVPSNFWLKSKELMAWVYQQTQQAAYEACTFTMDKAGDKAFSTFMEKHDLMDDIQNCINKGDLKLAQKLITHYDLVTV